MIYHYEFHSGENFDTSMILYIPSGLWAQSKWGWEKVNFKFLLNHSCRCLCYFYVYKIAHLKNNLCFTQITESWLESFPLLLWLLPFHIKTPKRWKHDKKIEDFHRTSRSIYFMQKWNMIMCTQMVHTLSMLNNECQGTEYWCNSCL